MCERHLVADCGSSTYAAPVDRPKPTFAGPFKIAGGNLRQSDEVRGGLDVIELRMPAGSAPGRAAL